MYVIFEGIKIHFSFGREGKLEGYWVFQTLPGNRSLQYTRGGICFAAQFGGIDRPPLLQHTRNDSLKGSLWYCRKVGGYWILQTGTQNATHSHRQWHTLFGGKVRRNQWHPTRQQHHRILKVSQCYKSTHMSITFLETHREFPFDKKTLLGISQRRRQKWSAVV